MTATLSTFGIEFRQMRFSYPDAAAAVFDSFTLTIPPGSRVLVMGANGSGKSTLLKLISGRHLLPGPSLRVFGRSPFEDLSLARQIGLADGDFPVHVDLRVGEILEHPTPGLDRSREAELLQLLKIDPGWRMNRASEGQRRRVQLLLALRWELRILLLDEIAAHLDVVVRSDFFSWVHDRSRSSGMTVLYATHVFDGLLESGREPWPTHLLFLSAGRAPHFAAIEKVAALKKKSLHALCDEWIRRGPVPAAGNDAVNGNR